VTEPIFYVDFNSPYAYLAAHRVDRLLGADVRWQPIAFAFVVDGEPFWGDDRLEAAATRLAA
jgi:2-hydroxychromene-2-carboxylate isomerase